MPRFLCFVPLFRCFNPGNGDHLYTIDIAERNKSLSIGYIYERVECYVLNASDDTMEIMEEHNMSFSIPSGDAPDPLPPETPKPKPDEPDDDIKVIKPGGILNIHLGKQ